MSARRFVVIAVVATLTGCTGPRGPEGQSGTQGEPGAPGAVGAPGATGDAGSEGAPGCDGLAAGQSVGLEVSLQISSPQNGQYFVTGERPELTIKLADRCGRLFKASALGTANLYLSGPRGLEARTAKALNSVADRAAADRQHHYIKLSGPKYADPSAANLSEAADGSLTYTLSPISDEAPGTYTAGVWATSKDSVDQVMKLAELQIGTATRAEWAPGDLESSACYDCHKGPASGKSYQIHIIPGRSPMGNYALDQYPIAGCTLCHNADGYSRNPIVRKVHGAHRGKNQKAVGAAHPEYGLAAADTTLAEFLNVGFPAVGGEKNCRKCHQDDRWKTDFSRLACGTCHDNLFFDTGTLNPARVLGKPAAGACVADADCNAFGTGSACNTASGLCERRSHPAQTDDAQCVTCHADAPSALASVVKVHEVPQIDRIRGLRITDLSVSGATGANGVYQVGDVLTVKFKVSIKSGDAVADLKTNSALSGTLMVSGPTEDPQRVVGSLSMKTLGTLSYDSASGEYTYVLPAGLPATSLAPLNGDPASVRTNPAGTYSLYMYVTESFNPPGGSSYRDSVGTIYELKFNKDSPVRARQVISAAQCNSCHVDLALHGGSRSDPAACVLCHNRGAMDRIAGATGSSCNSSTPCGGADAGWESCQLPTDGGTAGTCVITQDPTPNASINYPYLVHGIHFGRLRGEHSERNNLAGNREITWIGNRNSVHSFGEVLFPMDIRNCQKCHADTLATCSATAPCGVGQVCTGGKCVNRAWQKPSAEVCLSCHDTEAAFGHASLNTLQTSPPVETCEVCHGARAEFAVERVHNISSPYVPPYPRERE